MQLSPIYLLLLTLASVFAFFYKNKMLAWALCVFMFVLAVFRGVEVGTDCLGYQKDYYIIKSVFDGNKIFHSFEIGFVGLIALFKQYVTSLYLPFVSVLFCVFWFGFLKFIKYYNIPLSLALFFLLTQSHYFYAYNIMRQMMALGLIVSVISWLYEKKYVKFCLYVIIVSMLFHKSSIIFAFLCVIHHYYHKCPKFFSKKNMYIAVILSFLFFFTADQTSMGMLASMAGLFYSRYEQYLLGSIGTGVETGYLFMGCQSLFVLALIFLYNNNERNKFEFIVYITGIVIFNVLSAISVVATRVAECFLVFNTVLFPMLMLDKTNKRLKWIRIVIVVVSLVLFFYRYGVKNDGLVNPYYFESRFEE